MYTIQMQYCGKGSDTNQEDGQRYVMLVKTLCARSFSNYRSSRMTTIAETNNSSLCGSASVTSQHLIFVLKPSVKTMKALFTGNFYVTPHWYTQYYKGDVFQRYAHCMDMYTKNGENCMIGYTIIQECQILLVQFSASQKPGKAGETLHDDWNL